MLVLSRRENESIIINSDIEVTILRIRGNRVRLGVKAPRDVAVHRREVYEAIQCVDAENDRQFNKSSRDSDAGR